MERDSANLFVLEGVIIALLMLGAAYAVQTLHVSSLDGVRPRSELERLTHDMLLVLAGLHEEDGTPLLDSYLASAYHCSLDAVPSTIDCNGRRSNELTLKLDNYLPLGAGYAVQVGNGIERIELYRSPLPSREVVAASHEIAPSWNLTFVATDMSCYDTGVPVGVTLVPIAKGDISYARWGNVSVGSAEYAGAAANATAWWGGAANTSRFWNVTLPAATRPASGTIVANVTGNASLDGATSYASCLQGGQGGALRLAAAGGTFTVSALAAPLASTVTFAADISSILSVPGVTVTAVNVSVIEPIPARGTTPDTWIEAGRVALTGSSARTGAWSVPAASLYGEHVALLRVGVTLGGVPVELHRVLTFDVALPSGEVPIDPPYRVALQTWLADWG